ncbi:sugar transporter-domain-containing protein [Nemania sp. FL0916]|nr:sugar transporter-domain-containing protein [Nemania sp. FL0916]
MAGPPGSTSRSARFTIPPLRSERDVELGARGSVVSTTPHPYQVRERRRHNNYQQVIESPLAHLTDEELERDVYDFQRAFLPSVKPEKLLRAAQVAKYIRIYDSVARSEDPDADSDLPVRLTQEEKAALKKEKDSLPSEPAMLIVILTVSLAAFLQGFVQSSINGASLYLTEYFHLDEKTLGENGVAFITGAVNASPFLFAAIVGCWLALPINERLGRRGAMAVAACLIFASSLGSAFCTTWQQLFAVRAVGGIGMGIKAVSTPILASETAIGYWRGTSILAWQLWVAFGIFVGFVFNLIFFTAEHLGCASDSADSDCRHQTTVGLILGSPFVPSIILLASLYFCPESPRYYMRQQSSHFDPQKAYSILVRLRGGEFRALRDVYLIYKSVQQEERTIELDSDARSSIVPRGPLAHIRAYLTQFKQLFTQRRLRNAVVSSSTVSLSQQLCGINVFAFYSGTLFIGVQQIMTTTGDPKMMMEMARNNRLHAMLYSLGFGAVNFIFGLPAIRTIDTLGRRKWLVLTLPLMSLFMAAAALATLCPGSVVQGGNSTVPGGNPTPDKNFDVRGGIVALFVFLFAAAYSPGLGPIPFTLASESFPLSHREAGCAFAIATNLLFAGLLSIFFPSISDGLGSGGALGLFSGLNLVALALVFLLVEETKRRSLEDLNAIFDVRKSRFTRYQVKEYLPWFFRRYVLHRDVTKPELYLDLIWGNHGHPGDHDRGDGVVEGENDNGRDNDANAKAQSLFNPGSPFGNNPNTVIGTARHKDDDHW